MMVAYLASYKPPWTFTAAIPRSLNVLHFTNVLLHQSIYPCDIIVMHTANGKCQDFMIYQIKGEYIHRS